LQLVVEVVEAQAWPVVVAAPMPDSAQLATAAMELMPRVRVQEPAASRAALPVARQAFPQLAPV
jgi:hypothetical protein